MRFGLIYELQLPRPWDADSEHRLVQQALTEVEVADHLGFDYVWANEHHFLEEYSHNSATGSCCHHRATIRRRMWPNASPCSILCPPAGPNGALGPPHHAPNWKASTSTRRRRS